MDCAAVMNSCDAQAERVGFAALTEIERIVVLVSRANFEIELGGFSSFYYNAAGDFAAECIDALEAIGAIGAAAALRKGNAMFPGGPPRDRQRRYEALRLVDVESALAALDREFYSENPDVFSRLCSFIEQNRSKLSGYSGDGN